MLQSLFLLTSALWAAAPEEAGPYVEVLGIAQDAGHPQAGCLQDCCSGAWQDPQQAHRVTSLAILDPLSKERWILDASPDFPAQLRQLDEAMPEAAGQAPSGIYLTHAHIGHYTGLMHLGREAMGAKGVPVWAMPRMRAFLEQAGPWELLTRLGNISLRSLQDEEAIRLNDRLQVQPFLVPHRGEYTETVGYVVTGPNKSILYLPDIDKWERWERPIEALIAKVDRAYLDGTFFADGEIQGRSMADIPHPFVQESLERFSNLPETERNKIHFIHLNHSNPLLQNGSAAWKDLKENGMYRASRGDRLDL